MTLRAVIQWMQRQIIGAAMYVSPCEREEWAKAMSSEVEEIPNVREALWWSLGCLRASCHERLKSTRPTNWWPVRWSMAVWIAFLSIDTLAYGGTTLAYKLGFYPLTEHRNVPLLEVTPLWEPIATLAVGVTFLLAIGLILKRSRAAFEATVTPLVAMLLLVAMRFDRPESDDLQSLSIAFERSHFVVIWPLAGLLLTVLMCWALWRDRQAPAAR